MMNLFLKLTAIEGDQRQMLIPVSSIRRVVPQCNGSKVLFNSDTGNTSIRVVETIEQIQTMQTDDIYYLIQNMVQNLVPRS